MRARLRLVIVGVILIGGVIVLIYAGYRFNWSWTGFGPETSEPKQHAKTLWDWLNLLGVLAIPAVVGLGAAWYTAQQGKVSERENTDNQRETALQAYIDKMSELLLHEKLRGSAEEDEVRKIARVRTLTILPRLDATRKRSVLQFLHESGLIKKDTSIIGLKGADLSEASLYLADRSGTSLWTTDLCGADLSEANLSRANLSYAKLREVDLRGADLRGADLQEADLKDADLGPIDDINVSGADLSGANLYKAIVTPEQLGKASSLKGATMPDGSKHP